MLKLILVVVVFEGTFCDQNSMSLVRNDSQICTVKYQMMSAVNDVSFGQRHCFYLPAHSSGDAASESFCAYFHNESV